VAPALISDLLMLVRYLVVIVLHYQVLMLPFLSTENVLVLNQIHVAAVYLKHVVVVGGFRIHPGSRTERAKGVFFAEWTTGPRVVMRSPPMVVQNSSMRTNDYFFTHTTDTRLSSTLF
jgi:hypothetical protein